MQNLDNRMIFSASDITGFLGREHLTQLELRAAKGLIKLDAYGRMMKRHVP